MNEYIILHAEAYEDNPDMIKSVMIDVKEIKYFYRSERRTFGRTFIKFWPEIPAIYVNESPSEIEALITGEPLKPKEIPEVWLDKDGSTYPLYAPINSAKEENAKLKEELNLLNQKFKNEKVEVGISYHYMRIKEFEERLKHSNPDNACCRETYKKLNESIFTISREDRLDLLNWNDSFRAALEKENKND